MGRNVMVTCAVLSGASTPRVREMANTSSGSTWKSYGTGTAEWLRMYSTREAVAPAATLPKLKARVESVTSGATAVPRRLSATRLPPAVPMWKVSLLNVPVARGV